MADEVRHRAVLGRPYLLGQVVGAGHSDRGLLTIGGELGTGSAGDVQFVHHRCRVRWCHRTAGGRCERHQQCCDCQATVHLQECDQRGVDNQGSCASRAGGRVGRPRERRGAAHNGWLSGVSVCGAGCRQSPSHRRRGSARGWNSAVAVARGPSGRGVGVGDCCGDWAGRGQCDALETPADRTGSPPHRGWPHRRTTALEADRLRPQSRSLAVLASSEHAHGRLYALPLHQHTYRYQSYAADSPREALAYWPWWGGSVSGGSAGSRRCPHPTSPTPCAASDSKD